MDIPKLETGMLVKLADDTVAIVIKDCVEKITESQSMRRQFALVDSRGDAIYSNWYAPDLTHSRHSSGDIVEIRGSNTFNPRCILDLMDNKFNQLPVLWKKETAKKMTLEELESVLGYKIEIIN